MGDLRNALKKVQTSTRLIKLNPMVDIKEVSDGSVKEYLRIYHYLFLDYNAQIASDIVNKHNVELSYLNDKAFVDGVYRLCRDMLGFTPRLTKDQFFHAGFAQAKAEMAAEIIDRVRSLLPFSSTTASSFVSGEKESTVTAAIKAAKTASSSPNSFNSHRPVMASNLSRHHSARSASSTTHHIQMPTASRANYQTNRLLKAAPTSSSSSSSLKDASTNNSSAHESSHQSTSSNTSSHSVSEDDHKQQQAAIKTNTSTPTSIGASENGLLGLIEKINDMHAKMDCLAQMVQRVDLIDKRLENVEKLVTDSQQLRSSERIASNESVSRLSKTCEGITNKMTLLETELLVIKQSISQQQQQQQLQHQSRTSRLSYDPNDSTTYETPHQSFMMMASPNVTRSNNETATNDDLSGMHDSTLNGTDLTPTLLTETKTSNTASASRLSGRKSAFIDQDNEKESELNRARDLLQKASLFTSSLTSSTAASNLLA